jgi:exopolysaccharide biosynthesis WecB/TagA/CpsF family protein
MPNADRSLLDPSERPWRRIPLLGAHVDDLTMAETIDAVDTLIRGRGAHQHIVINVARIVAASRDPELRSIIDACSIINADGQPVVWASRLLGVPLRERVAGIDLMSRLIEEAGPRGHRIYLLGARPDVLREVVDRIAREHPTTVIAGYRDGYWSADEEPAVAAEIAEARADILFVAISSPVKERFLARWKDTLGTPFMMGVGGSFDVYAGRVRRAPRSVQNVGLEWLFRLAQEPRRMWRRYLGDALPFAALVWRAWWARRRKVHAPSAADGAGDRLRIAIMGTRGIPAAYGGFETFAEELGARLADRGHSVTVYGRSHSVAPTLTEHRGMHIRVLPTIRHKYFDTVANTALSVVDGLPRRFSVVLMCNNANAPFAVVPRLGRAKVVLNVDGLEWERGKWNRAGRWYYKFCAWLAPKLPVTLVSDAQVIARWYEERYGKPTVFIPYGTDARRLPPGETLRRLGLQRCGYLLYVSRLEPENNAHIVLAGYRQAGGLERLGVSLVIVGDAPYATHYKTNLARTVADTPGAMMTGYIFGDGYAELQSSPLAYIQATEVGGTHPALVEAMGRGATIIANDVPEHREVLGDTGLYYERNDAASLAARIVELASDPAERDRLGAAAAERARRTFSWDGVTDAYERLFFEVTQPRST